MNPITLLLSSVFLLAAIASGAFVNLYIGIGLFVIAVLIAMSVSVANVWEKFVILRIGKLQSVKGAGLFMIVPVLDNIVAVVDEYILSVSQAKGRVCTVSVR